MSIGSITEIKRFIGALYQDMHCRIEELLTGWRPAAGYDHLPFLDGSQANGLKVCFCPLQVCQGYLSDVKGSVS